MLLGFFFSFILCNKKSYFGVWGSNKEVVKSNPIMLTEMLTEK